MKLNWLELQYFKNYESLRLEFQSGVHFIVGLNGCGKTNILDAIHYLAFTKSGIQSGDLYTIRHEKDYFRVKGNLIGQKGQFEVLVFADKTKKKVVKKDEVIYEKFSEHIGEVPMVMIAPDDILMINEASEVRRKWVDGCLSQADSIYLDKLMTYQKLLKQRNQLLKTLEGKMNHANSMLLDTYDAQLFPLNEWISNQRENFIFSFGELFRKNLLDLVPTHENCEIGYKSQLKNSDFATEFKKSRSRDLMMERTGMGIHRDDFIFFLNDQPLKRFGSQGQQKSFLIALKLAQYDYLSELRNEKPLLLLDDLFDKLDDERIAKLLQMFDQQDRFEQVLITDARKERSMKFYKRMKNATAFEVTENRVIKL